MSFKKNPLIILVFLTFFLLFYGSFFGFHRNNDTDGFIYSIELFRGNDVELYAQRYLNPMYPLVAGKILFFLSPASALIVLNIICYFGIAFLTYGLIRRVFNSELAGLLTSLIIATSYPMIRYALTQVQDMGGYFWFVATLYAAWRWFSEKKWQWLVIGSVTTAFGLLTKESGAMASVFFGILMIVSDSTVLKKIVNLLVFSIAPLLTLVVNKIRSADVGYDTAAWFLDNWRIYYESHYTLFKWAAINFSTFNVLWILFGLGLFILIRDRKIVDRRIYIYLFAVLPSSLSYFAWPLFISRTVFISAWLIVPVAVFAIEYLLNGNKYKRVLGITSFLIILISPSLLQSTLRYAHVFKIYDDCNKKIICSWDYFWKHRGEFSKEL